MHLHLARGWPYTPAMADPSALQDYGAPALLGALLFAGIGLAKSMLNAILRGNDRQQDTLESMDRHLNVLTGEVKAIRRELERRTEVTPSEVPHPTPRAQPLESIPYRRKLPTRGDE